MTTVGNQYFATTSAGSVDTALFYLQFSDPASLTVGNFDNNGLATFPLETLFTEYIEGPNIAKVDFYSSNSQLAATVWIDLLSVSSPTTTTTSYNIVDYVLRGAADWSAWNVFFIMTGFLRLSTSTGPTGPTGSTGFAGPDGTGLTGPTGPAGDSSAVTGPTGAARTVSFASVKSSGSDQTFATTTPQVVICGTVGVPSTNTADITISNSDQDLTCVSSGVYRVNASVNWVGTSLDAGSYVLAVRVNGLETESRNLAVSGGTTVSQSLNTVLSLTANDLVDLEVTAPSATSVSLSGTGTAVSTLSLERIA